MNIKKYMATGILSIVPIYLTYVISKVLFQFFANPGAQFFDYIYRLIGKDNVKFLPEIFGFAGVLLIIYIIGMLVSSIFVKKVLFSLERIIAGIPVVNIIYKTIKQITSSLGDPDKESFKKVVLIEYPRKSLWTLAMVTGESIDKESNEYYNIYVPTTPNPTSGFMLYTLKDEVVETEISVEEGLKIIISGGVIGPNMNGITKK
tara:strand:+ start:912 stop:1523 length:612 start_codon:yes stop_codon:yes gene_type:complete